MRRALRLWLGQQTPQSASVFGLWRDRPGDALELQQRPAISLITWMEVLVSCQPDEAPVVQRWLEGFDRIAINPCVAEAALSLRREHALNLPEAIILATAQCSGLVLATRNTKDFPLRLGDVLHPYEL